ncbi:hypothetical protein OAH05_00545 [bacterium]|nr:hypothetical protein [bacterium]
MKELWISIFEILFGRSKNQRVELSVRLKILKSRGISFGAKFQTSRCSVSSKGI